jgi:predicted esterase
VSSGMRLAPPRVLAIAGVLLAAACTQREPRRARETPTRDAAVSRTENQLAEVGTRDAGLPPLGGAPWLERLELPGGGVALVSVPLGATEPRPIMVAVHGAGDRPEWACGGWRGVARAYPFIVCPEGAPTGDDRFYWLSTKELQRRVDGAVAAVRERFGGYVSNAPMVYAGFSAGAIYGASLVRDEADRFPTIAMSEGGYEELTDPTFAVRFHANGGRRVLLGCSTGPGCVARLSEARRLFERAGVEARVNDAGAVGHNLNAEVVQSLRRDWSWLVQDREGWSSYGVSSARALPEGEGGPIEVKEEEVPDDLPAFFLRGAKETSARLVFLTGACTHPEGYMQAFQFAAHERGSMLGLQGDVGCGGPYRRWSFDLAKQNARIEAGFEAAGEAKPLNEVVIIGYSQGAILAELLAAKYPERYTRVILIAAPTEPSPVRLRHVRAAVMIATDAETERMKAGALALAAAGIPTTYLAMPHARHGQMTDAERVMDRALEWVTTQERM